MGNTTSMGLCNTAMLAFSALTKECQLKKSSEACTCWTNSTLEFTVSAVKKCDISSDNKKMTAAKKACTTAFGKCRKLEDDVSTALSACSPANTKARATADIKQGLKNKAAATKATTKINYTATATTRAATIMTCAAFITLIGDATTEILRSPLLSGTATKLTKVADASVGTCTDAEKTTLSTLATTMSNTAVAIDLNIASKQTDLLTSTGTTVSVSTVQAEIDAADSTATASATTAAGATAAANTAAGAGATTAAGATIAAGATTAAGA